MCSLTSLAIRAAVLAAVSDPRPNTAAVRFGSPAKSIAARLCRARATNAHTFSEIGSARKASLENRDTPIGGGHAPPCRRGQPLIPRALPPADAEQRRRSTAARGPAFRQRASAENGGNAARACGQLQACRPGQDFHFCASRHSTSRTATACISTSWIAYSPSGSVGAAKRLPACKRSGLIRPPGLSRERGGRFDLWMVWKEIHTSPRLRQTASVLPRGLPGSLRCSRAPLGG